MRKLFVLGPGSFVGRRFCELLREKGVEFYPVPKEELNFLQPSTFGRVDFNGGVIVDFINVNNGVEDEISACNYEGFRAFCTYLSQHAKGISYVYISTISVISEEIVAINPYVRSKKMAEDILFASGIDCQAIRLSYPIGKGENSTRLITRLVNNLKANKAIKISPVMINLNDVRDVVNQVYARLLKEKTIFISSNKYISLVDVVLFLKEQLGSSSHIDVAEAGPSFIPLSGLPFEPSCSIWDTLKDIL